MRVRLFASATVLAAAGFVACNDSTTAPASTTFIATMTGANERPTPNTSTATGTATYVLTGNLLSYVVTVNGLTAPASGAHIHVGASTVAGPIVVPYTVSATQSGVVSTGTIDLTFPIASGNSTITGDSLKVLLNNGNAYTNVHNSSFPGGEIRGQIIKQ
ncbi:MAG TPA: CHRD domain-containing protein [Gemmatimonadaceae bacterium]|nr:CHRD domain-containing protein [Gemmatimonadaceae bacterium]